MSRSAGIPNSSFSMISNLKPYIYKHWLLIFVLFISSHLISPKDPFCSWSSFFLSFFSFCSFESMFFTPQVNPGQWSQLAMAPMVAGPPNGDPHDIPRTRMGAPLAIPEAPLVYHQQQMPPQVPHHHQQGGGQVSYQGVGSFNPPGGSATPYNNGQFHQFHQQSDPGDARPMWVPPSPY